MRVPLAAALAVLLASAGCRSVPAAVDSYFDRAEANDAARWVRGARGKGVSVVIDAPYSEVYAAAVRYFQSSSYHSVDPQLRAVFADDYHGLYSAAIFLSPGAGPSRTVVEAAYRQEISDTPDDGRDQAVEASLLSDIAALVKQTEQPRDAELAAVDELKTPLMLSDVDRLPDRGRVKQRSGAYAVVVGVSRYRGLPRVEFAAHDAGTFARYARDVLGVPEAHVELLSDAGATRGSVLAALRRARPDATELIVYFAGHGEADPATGRAVLLPWDSDRERPLATGIALDELVRTLVGGTARSRVVFVDACFSGGGRSVAAGTARPLIAARLPRPGAASVMTAAGADEISGADPALGHGLFTYYLLQGLSRRSSQKAIALACLYDYLRPRVAADAARLGWKQTPQLFLASGLGEAEQCASAPPDGR